MKQMFLCLVALTLCLTFSSCSHQSCKNLNDDFAVDFREREISENGDGALTDYTDQEILAMLKDEDTLVLFYTPMGLEVGLNLDGEIVYVTYEDYMDYRNIF